MQSKTSSFKGGVWFSPTLFRKNLTRFWPLWAIYAAVWLVGVPMVQFVTLFGENGRALDTAALRLEAEDALLSMGISGGLWIGGFFGLLFAMALFSYLYSSRSVGMFHAFPVRREGLFLTNYLTGAAVFAAVLALCAVLTAALQAAAGVLNGNNLLVFFLCAAGQMLFFYSFACFCAMFTGQILALPAFYLILNVLAVGVSQLVQSLAAAFLFGYTGGGSPAWVIWLTPAWRLERQLQLNSEWDEALGRAQSYSVTGFETLAVYAAAGVVLAVLALAICRVRRSETAGDTVSLGPVKPVFRTGVALCAALSLGQGLYYLIWAQFCPKQSSLAAMLGFMIFGGLVGYYAAQMLLYKSFRVFKKSWRGAVVLCAALVVFGLAVRFDLIGVERRVPPAASVESMDFSISGETYLSGSTADQALIEKFCAAHRGLVQNKAALLAAQEQTGGRSGYFQLTYNLKNGGSVSRGYTIPYDLSNGADKDFTAGLRALAQEPGVLRTAIFSGLDPETLTVTGGGFSYFVTDPGSGDFVSENTVVGTAQAQVLLRALLEDIDAGRMGASVFSHETWASEGYANTLTLFFDRTSQSGKERYADSFSVQFSAKATALLAALKDEGILGGDVRLTTNAEANGEDGEQAAAEVTALGAEGKTLVLENAADGETAAVQAG